MVDNAYLGIMTVFLSRLPLENKVLRLYIICLFNHFYFFEESSWQLIRVTVINVT